MAEQEPEKEHKESLPPWLVSFGDMMTLLMTFFILLTTLAPKQDGAALASTIGSLEVQMKTPVFSEELSGSDQRSILDGTRQRFNLPPVDADDKAETPEDAQLVEVVEAQALESRPRLSEQLVSRIAAFEGVRTSLGTDELEFLRKRIEWLRPGPDELLVVEVEPDDGPARFAALSRAQRRAEYVRERLVEVHGFRSHRVEARVAPYGNKRAGNQPGEVRARILRQLKPKA